MTEKTFKNIRDKHLEVKEALEEGNNNLIAKMMDIMFVLAVGGYQTEKIQTHIEKDTDGKEKKKIVKTQDKLAPDYRAIRFILSVKGGRDYKENKEELDIMEKRANNGEEVWLNENSDEKPKYVNRIQK